MRVVVLLVVASCGRINFDAPTATGDGAQSDDTIQLDALPPGLVVWFPLGDTVPQDVVGGGVGTCAPPACPVQTAGHRGTGLLFDGNDDCILVADYPALHQPQLTLGIWAFLNAAQDAAAVAKRVDVMTSANDTWELGAGLGGELELTTNHGGSSEQITTAAGAVSTTSWHHFAFTWDGSNKRIYLDGVERGNGTSVQPLNYDGQQATIGCDDNGSPVRFFKGVLDELMIFDYAMTSAEVAQLTTL